MPEPMIDRDDVLRGRLEAFVDGVQRGGRYTFTTPEAARGTRLTAVGLGAALRRLEARGRIARPLPRRGFHVVVPHEFHSMGGPPLPWYLDALMRFVGEPHYHVGLLTAAEWHGATHFAVQEAQVCTATQLRPVQVGRERIRFVRKTGIERTPVEERPGETGRTRVSTPEATAVDLVRYLDAAGGLSMAATALAEMRLSAPGLTRALDAAGDVTAAQRLGFLLHRAGHENAARAVLAWLRRRPHRPRALDPQAPVELAEIAYPWRVLVNADVEVSA
jgi:AbiEi antitoxin C-terminal domain